MKDHKIKCTWCQKEYDWDWELDTIVGCQEIVFTKPDNKETEDFELHLILCDCGGSLCVVTLEPNGSTVLESCNLE